MGSSVHYARQADCSDQHHAAHQQYDPIQAIDRIHDATVLYEYLLHILAAVRKRHHDSIFQGTAIGPQLCMYRYLSPNVIHAAKEVMQANSTPYCLNKYKTT
ncbi:hypothetical protein CFAM422_008346 [Trichoderma lentiforme]|uniref:Uncharacterized protein n=1 Tax=Trichoderma lentiforme TaxID=1567552 RepID=A0A9P4XBB8_9HYPO|nr:hypothetical protein CFAM422_008346 [Trichoderma lentiforme]